MAVLALACLPLTARAQTPETKTPTGAVSPAAVPSLPPVRNLSSYQGMVVRDIVFQGIQEDNQASSHLRDVVAQEVGKPLDRQKLRDSLQALYKTGRFADLQVRAQQTSPNELTLVFVGKPNYFVGSLTASGAPGRPSNNQLIDSSKLRLGEVVNSGKIDQALTRIRTVLRDNGLYRAAVTVQRKEHPETQLVDLHFQITPGEPARVGRVTVEGSAGYSESEIADIANMKPGDKVTQERVTKAFQKLRKKYTKQNRLESQISITDRIYNEDTNTVDYVFKIERGPTVDIHLEGASISQGRLKKLVPVYEEHAVDNDLLNEGRRNIRDHLQTQGYFDTKVNFQQDFDKEKDHLHVIYDVDRGEKHDLVKVGFNIEPGTYISPGLTGPYFGESELLERVQVQARSLILSHGRFSQAMMTQDVENLVALYKSNGFLEVKVESTLQSDYNGKAGDMAVFYKIVEGPQTRVGSITIQGSATFGRDQLPELQTSEGQAYADTNIALDRDTILNFYFDKGFPDTQFEAKVSPTPNQPHSMDVTYTIVEGQQFFVDRILTSQLDFTRPQTVRRQFDIQPGDPLSQSKLSNTQSNLYNLGVFNEVRMAVQNPDGQAKYKDVLMQFQEARRWTFNYGLGFEVTTSSPDQQSCQRLAEQGQTSLACSEGRYGASPRASFGISRINFRGLAHTITFKSTVGRLQRRALFSYEAPRWFGKPNWKLTFTSFYDNSINVTTFTSERLESSIQAEQTYSKVSHFLYRLAYRRVKASDLVVSPDQVPLYSRPVRVAMPSFTYIRDKRDDPIDTKNGNFTSFDTGVASRYFGSQASFGRFLIQNATYHPFKGKKWVFARNLRLGVAEPFGDDFIPLPERFFAGGSNLLRGFSLNQAGPRDLQTGSPLGGNAVVVNSLELRTPPLVLPWVNNNLSFAFFHDAGNVFTDATEMAHNIFRWSQKNPEDCRNESRSSLCSFAYISHAVGTGIRYKTPIGPMRVDIGYNLNPTTYPTFEPGDNSTTVFVPRVTRRWNVFFSIGQTF
ncbi:MAG TPA: POTRA domain-containing protein [Terriglobales bacterium]|nr:POTRA domain-containing protein [Terriglobales bacterium]